jgi:hypothetical protein
MVIPCIIFAWCAEVFLQFSALRDWVRKISNSRPAWTTYKDLVSEKKNPAVLLNLCGLTPAHHRKSGMGFSIGGIMFVSQTLLDFRTFQILDFHCGDAYQVPHIYNHTKYFLLNIYRMIYLTGCCLFAFLLLPLKVMAAILKSCDFNQSFCSPYNLTPP